jgi:hypothetical protein
MKERKHTWNRHSVMAKINKNVNQLPVIKGVGFKVVASKQMCIIKISTCHIVTKNDLALILHLVSALSEWPLGKGYM